MARHPLTRAGAGALLSRPLRSPPRATATARPRVPQPPAEGSAGGRGDAHHRARSQKGGGGGGGGAPRSAGCRCRPRLITRWRSFPPWAPLACERTDSSFLRPGRGIVVTVQHRKASRKTCVCDISRCRAPLHRSTSDSHRHAADVELYSSTALSSSTALQRSTLYILYTLPQGFFAQAWPSPQDGSAEQGLGRIPRSDPSDALGHTSSPGPYLGS